MYISLYHVCSSLLSLNEAPQPNVTPPLAFSSTICPSKSKGTCQGLWPHIGIFVSLVLCTLLSSTIVGEIYRKGFWTPALAAKSKRSQYLSPKRFWSTGSDQVFPCQSYYTVSAMQHVFEEGRAWESNSEELKDWSFSSVTGQCEKGPPWTGERITNVHHARNKEHNGGNYYLGKDKEELSAVDLYALSCVQIKHSRRASVGELQWQVGWTLKGWEVGGVQVWLTAFIIQYKMALIATRYEAGNYRSSIKK